MDKYKKDSNESLNINKIKIIDKPKKSRLEELAEFEKLKQKAGRYNL